MSEQTNLDAFLVGEACAQAIIDEIAVKRRNRLIGPETTREEALAWAFLTYAKRPVEE